MVLEEPVSGGRADSSMPCVLDVGRKLLCNLLLSEFCDEFFERPGVGLVEAAVDRIGRWSRFRLCHRVLLSVDFATCSSHRWFHDSLGPEPLPEGPRQGLRQCPSSAAILGAVTDSDRFSRLVKELDDLRQRTIELAQLASGGYVAKAFPVLEELLASSSFRDHRYVDGLRALLLEGALRSPDPAAVQKLFGLDGAIGSATERADLALNKIGRQDVSQETKTRLIRGMRESLATKLIEIEAERAKSSGAVGGTPDLPPIANKLVRWSDRLVADLSGQFDSPLAADTEAAQSLYVARHLEPVLLARLAESRRRPQIVRGDAGVGKSSLLWGLHRALVSEPGVRPVLVSATWLATQVGEAGTFTVEEIVESVRILALKHERVVVLLDTADLLLHSELSQQLMADLIAFIEELGAGLVVATRPLEAEQGLAPNVGAFETLGPYDEAEMTVAVDRLARRFTPDHPVSDALVVVTTAVTRELPISDICKSPLLLRMLFELSEGDLPAMELDVTGLYQRYWEHRVRDDRRMARPTRQRTGRDISQVVRACAAVMLAMGTPEPDLSVLTELMEQIASAATGNERWGASQGLEEMIARGILEAAGPRVKFFHQTMFEFAAAVELVTRDPRREFERLTSYLIDYPTDLFRGAVLEQALVLASRNPLAISDVNVSVSRLFAAGHVALESIALSTWAHTPGAVDVPSESLVRVSTTALARVAQIVPTVADITIGDKLTVLKLVWNASNTRAATATIGALARLLRAHPSEVYDFYVDAKCLDYVLGPGSAMLTNAESFLDVVIGLLVARPERMHADAIRLLAGLSEMTVAITFLDRLAEVWPSVRGEDFAARIVTTTERNQAKNGDAHGRSVRRSLGTIIAAELLSGSSAGLATFWYDLARSTRDAIVQNDADVRAGAQLFVLADHLEASKDSVAIEIVFEILLTIDAVKAPRKLTANFLAPLLERESLARGLLIARLAGMLEFLPVAPNTVGAEGGVWASVARSTLEDNRVPVDIVAEVLRRLPGSRQLLFSSRDYAISLLPAAVRAKDPDALAVLNGIVDGSIKPEAASLTKLLQEARAHVEESAILASAYVALAVSRGDIGLLMTTAEIPAMQEALLGRTEKLRETVNELLRSNGGHQRDAAGLWSALQKAEILAPGVRELDEAVGVARDPIARSVLVGMLPGAAAASTAEEALNVLSRFGSYDTDAATFRPVAGRNVPLVVLDATAIAWLRLLSEYGPANERTSNAVITLCVRPRENQSNTPDVAGFRYANRYMARLVEQGDSELAVGALILVGRTLTEVGFSSKQQRNASNMVHYAIRRVVAAANTPQLEAMIDAFPKMTPVLSLFLARAALQTHPSGAFERLERILAENLPEGLAEPVATDLRERSRFGGSSAMPDFMSPAS